MTAWRITLQACIACCLAAGFIGCSSSGGGANRLGTATWTEPVRAWCDPPVGWIAEPLKASSQHMHQIWLSPDGQTAYGVIHFSLPLPVGPDLVLWGFMREMRRSEGSADLLFQQDDPTLPGTRFTAQGKIYRIRGNLILSGWEGWVVYAGTQGPKINDADLRLAIRSREDTRVADGTSGRIAPK